MQNKKLIVQGDALKKYQQERMFSAQEHLGEQAKLHGARFAAQDMVISAAIAAHGLPADPLKFYEEAKALAAIISDDRMKVAHEDIRDLFAELNIHDVPTQVEWAAKKSGVDLFPKRTEETARTIEEAKEPSKLVLP